MRADNLRTRLRADTRSAHQRLDRVAAGLDLSDRKHSEIFTAAHIAAYQSILGQSGDIQTLLSDRLARARFDAEMLGVDADDCGSLSLLKVEQDLAISYVVSGSSQGARLLLRQRSKSDDAELKSASRLLHDQGLELRWKALVEALKEMPASGSRADRIVTSAIAVFEQFYAAFASATQKMRRDAYVSA